MSQTSDIKYIFTPTPVVGLPIINRSDYFPVRRILCVGQNYADHALEMGGDPTRDVPFFFGKPNEALLALSDINSTVSLPYPRNTESFHHEVELVIALGNNDGSTKNTYDFSSPEKAEKHILGYALALDMTRRDVQHQLKQQSRPWEAAKAMEQSAPISPILLANDLATSVEETQISLLKNEQLVQIAPVSHLIWSCAELLQQASRYFDLCAGDLIFTGTPAGVGPVHRGDLLSAHWQNANGDDLLRLQTQVI